MKNVVCSLLIALTLLLAGCTNYRDDPNFVEIANGTGFYINGHSPTLIVNEQFIVPLVRDERVFGKWIVAAEDGGEASLTIGTDNIIYINNQAFAKWYWFAPDMIVTDTGYQNSLIYFIFDGDNPNLVLFTEMDETGNYNSFIGVRDLNIL